MYNATCLLFSLCLSSDPQRGGSEMRGRCCLPSGWHKPQPGIGLVVNIEAHRFPFQIYLCIMFNIRTDGTLKKGRLVLMYICYVHILTDLHSNKSFILLYCAPDMKRQQIMGGCSPPWEAREQIKRKATRGNKAMFWCCVIKWRQRAKGSGTLCSPLYPYFIIPFFRFGFLMLFRCSSWTSCTLTFAICTNCPASLCVFKTGIWAFGEAERKDTGFGVDLVSSLFVFSNMGK